MPAGGRAEPTGSGPAVSVVIRVKDEAENLGRLLDILEGQDLNGEAEVIVVDSGSRDASPEIARERVDELIEIPASAFTFGRALNLGADAAHAPVIVALSAHAYPRDAGWLRRMRARFDGDDRIACVAGATAGPDDSALTGALRQDFATARGNPFWGYTNGAGGFRADLWRQRPFLEHLPGAEDKEWAWHWLSAGKVAVLDPALTVDHDHSRDPIPDCYRRARREWEGFAAFLDLDCISARGVVRRWWSGAGLQTSRWRARRDPWRIASLIGRWVGCRRGRALRT